MTYRALIVGAALLAGALACRAAEGAAKVELIESKKIWDRASHNAFTDLIRFRDAWYCVFREGSAHVPGTDGVIRVLRGAADGAVWESVAEVAETGVDLRDPKLSVTPDGRLMLLMGGSFYDGQAPKPGRKRVGAHSRVSFSPDGRAWTAPRAVTGVGDEQWLWRVTWQKGAGYGTVYSTSGKAGAPGRVLTIWRTADGAAYEKVAEPTPPVDLSEATIRFTADDAMVVLLRGEAKDHHAWIGVATSPYQKFEWRDGGRVAAGPDFVVMKDGRMFYGGRDFDAKGAARTVFGRMTAEKLEPLVWLASGGDTSYPRLVEAGEGVVWMSYYSSHEGKAAIYLAKVRVGG